MYNVTHPSSTVSEILGVFRCITKINPLALSVNIWQQRTHCYIIFHCESGSDQMSRERVRSGGQDARSARK